jgi:hypothetical protein
VAEYWCNRASRSRRGGRGAAGNLEEQRGAAADFDGCGDARALAPDIGTSPRRQDWPECAACLADDHAVHALGTDGLLAWAGRRTPVERTRRLVRRREGRFARLPLHHPPVAPPCRLVVARRGHWSRLPRPVIGGSPARQVGRCLPPRPPEGSEKGGGATRDRLAGSCLCARGNSARRGRRARHGSDTAAGCPCAQSEASRRSPVVPRQQPSCVAREGGMAQQLRRGLHALPGSWLHPSCGPPGA